MTTEPPCAAPPPAEAPPVCAEPAATTRRAMIGWSLFSLSLAALGCWLVAGPVFVRLWYFEYRFRRAGDESGRHAWARKIAALPSESATQTLRAHALDEDEDRALAAALALSSGLCPGAEAAFEEVRRAWSAERTAAFGWMMLKATGQDKSLLPLLLQGGGGVPIEVPVPKEGKTP
jgi:hypothetical protein